MSKERFERLVSSKMEECVNASMSCLGDPTNHALHVGTHKGLKMALDLYRQSIREDIEE